MAESFLQSYPNIKVVACIGDGSAIGVNEAVKASGKASADFGIFAADATEEACDKIIKPEEPFRASVSLGTPEQLANQVYDICMKLVNGEPLDAKIYNLDAKECQVTPWYQLENVRYFYDFFKKHEKEFTQ